MTTEPTADERYLRTVLDAIPLPVLVVDDDVRILDANREALRLLGDVPEIILRRRSGEVLHCIYAQQAPDGCGTSDVCPDCTVRRAVHSAHLGKGVARERSRMLLQEAGGVHEVYMLVTASPFRHQGQQFILLVLEDITELTELRDMVPICANCKKIRNDEQYWEHVESYLSKRIAIQFSHGICPDCMKKLYPELYPE